MPIAANIPCLGPEATSTRTIKWFIPISADGCGQVLFVDLRPGSWHGCVSEWDHEQGFLDVPTWRSIAKMLADMADALESGRPALTGHAERCRASGFKRGAGWWARVDDAGELEWVDRIYETPTR